MLIQVQEREKKPATPIEFKYPSKINAYNRIPLNTNGYADGDKRNIVYICLSYG